MRNRFARGSGVYICSDCGKQTRDTAGEAASGLCRTCYDAAETYNLVQDGEMPEDEFQEYLKRIGYIGHEF